MADEMTQQAAWYTPQPIIFEKLRSNTTTESSMSRIKTALWGGFLEWKSWEKSEVKSEAQYSMSDSQVIRIWRRNRVQSSLIFADEPQAPKKTEGIESLTWFSHRIFDPDETDELRLIGVLSESMDDNARELADAQSLWHFLALACRKVCEFFPNPKCQRIVYVADPEDDESWLSMRIATSGSLEDICVARKQYRQFWVRNVPIEARQMIRLMYDIN